MPYLSASAVVIYYEEALYQVYAPYLTLPMDGSGFVPLNLTRRSIAKFGVSSPSAEEYPRPDYV